MMNTFSTISFVTTVLVFTGVKITENTSSNGFQNAELNEQGLKKSNQEIKDDQLDLESWPQVKTYLQNEDQHATLGINHHDAKPAKPDANADNYLDIEKLFSFHGKDLWSKEYLQLRIKIRLVKKSWQTWGPSNKTEDILAEFLWDESIASHLTTCLHETPPYQFIERPLTEGHSLFSEEDFHKDLPNIFIFPTTSDHQDVDFMQKTVTALGMRNIHRSNNVFTFDMTQLDFNMFFSVLHTYFGENPNISQMGKAVADFFINAKIKSHMDETKIHLVGWDYSGQLIGYVGRQFYLTTGKKIKSIVALDPVGVPHSKFLMPVNKEDAELVYVYHSNSYPLGSTAKVGTADFVFNGGFYQPECEAKEAQLLCSHDGVVRRFWYVLLYGGNLFEARECDSLVRFNFGLCNKNPTVKLIYPITGSNHFNWLSWQRAFCKGPSANRTWKYTEDFNDQMKESTSYAQREQNHTGKRPLAAAVTLL